MAVIVEKTLFLDGSDRLRRLVTLGELKLLVQTAEAHGADDGTQVRVDGASLVMQLPVTGGESA